jgi:hypothetical protein
MSYQYNRSHLPDRQFLTTKNSGKTVQDEVTAAFAANFSATERAASQ